MSGKYSRGLLCVTLLPAIHFFLSSYTLLPLNRVAEKKVILSHLPGSHEQSVNVSVFSPKGTYIVYTKDGNLPGKSSPRWEKDIRFDKTTPLTIGLVVDNQLLDTFYCGTYLIGFHSSLPVTCLITPPDELLGPENGIYVGGLTPEGKTYGNCWKDIERTTFFEFIEKEQPVVAQGCGLKIFGGMTRQNKEKSMRVIARDKYGKGKFKHRFFSTKERDVFNSIVLRTSGNDYLGTRFLDMMISSVAKDIGVDYLAYQPSVLFVNGIYWGIHNLREKMNDDYLEENYGVSSDSTDLILGNASAEVGSSKKYRELLRFLDKTPPDIPGYIDSLEERMDIQNYLNYIILEIQINNIDSRGNVRYWSSSSLDEKFRWVYYDGDLSFGNPRLNYLGKRLSETQTDWYNPNWSTFLLRKMMENKTLRNRFITQYCYLHSTMLSADTFESRINQFHDWLEPEIDRHLVRKDFKQSRSGWEGKVKNLKKFARIRDTTSILHLKESFSLGEMYTLEIDANAPDGFYSLWLNGNRLATLPYKGNFFKGVDTRLEIRSIHPLYRFIQWSDGNSNASRSLVNNKDTLLIVNAQLKKVPFTRHADQVFFKALATGRKDHLAFLFIMDSTRRHAPRKIYINDRRGDLPIECTLRTNEHQLLICNDAVKFRKRYPLYKGQVIQMKELRLNNDIQTLYMFAANGDLMDSIQFRGIKGVLNTNIPFYQRDSIYLTGTFAIPTLDPPVFPDEDQETKEMYITFWTGLALTLMLIFGSPYLIMRRKRPRMLIFLPLVLACSSLSAQGLLNSPQRQLNTQKLLSSSKISRKLPEKTNCTHFYCAYAPVKSRLIWVAPFAKSDFLFKHPLHEGKQKFYKELPSDDEMHTRMLYTGDTIRNFIRGILVETFPLDTRGKWKLVKVVHANGMESWYYPVSVDGKVVLHTQMGSVLGTSQGTYYWEIRYRERSIALSGILVSEMEPDPKGYFLESGKDINQQIKIRYEGFMRSLKIHCCPGKVKLKGKKMGGEPPKRMISLSYQTKTLILCPNIAFLPDSLFLHSY